MNILYINHYAGSPRHGMEFRPYYLAREWVAAGHKVRILASGHSHVRAQQPELHGAGRLDETIDGVDYTWYAGPGYAGNGVGRIRNMVSFLRRLYADGRDLAKRFKPDVVIASSTYPMDIWPARRIARFAGAKLVFEVHDLWPLSPIELGGMSRRHPFIMWVQAAEDYAYRHADIVISLLPNVHDYMAARGLDLSKLAIVPNGVNPAEWEGEPRSLSENMVAQLTAIRNTSRGIVGYAGSHGLANALDELLRCAAAMRDDSVAFVLVGDGPEKYRLVEQAAAAGLSNVHFFDPINKQSIPALLQWFDIAYIGLQPHPLFRFGISPNKLFDYMMAGRVVLQSIDAGKGSVQMADCGLCVNPGDIGEKVFAIDKLLSMSPQQRLQMGERGRSFVLENHVYPVLATRFLEEVASASEQRRLRINPI